MKRLGMSWKISILAVLNLFDLVATLWELENGAWELNPLLRWAYEISPWIFVASKMGIFMAGAGFLWANRDHPKAHRAALVAMACFALLTLYQLASILYLLSVSL